MNISNWITTNARFSPAKAALIFEDKTWTYKELEAEIARVASVLKHELGVQKGDRVGILSFNRPEYLTLLFACARLGAMLNPINWRLEVPELMFICENAGHKVLLLEKAFDKLVGPFQEKGLTGAVIGFDYSPNDGKVWSEFASKGDAPTDNVGALEDDILLVYTSGTTGTPKGAVLTQDNLQWNALNAVHMMNLTAEDHVLTMLPLFHVGGLNNQTTPAFYSGATVTLHDKFDPADTLEAINSAQISVACFVPAIMAACINMPKWDATNFERLRLIVTGSTLVPTYLSDHFREKDVTVQEMYGLTETAPVSVYHRPDSDFSKIGSTGLPGLHTAIRIVDLEDQDVPPREEGEILIKGPNVMRGYWQNPEATADTFLGDWFRSGDIGYQDEEGYVYIKDRKKNMIISGSENIYAAEVERVLYQHPAVIECAVIGRKDTKWGEVPIGIIATAEGESVTADELHEHMAGKLARFKHPKEYIFADELPKNAMGKIQHFLVREQFK